MNGKKSKNKKPHKPPNPPQKIEVATAEPKMDDLEQNIQESDIKTEKRVPEIISEVIAPIMEIKEKETDAPKIPKRSRGKKKKTDNEDVVDVHEGRANYSMEANIDNVVNPETISIETTNVMPTARKKKNKKKGDEQIKEKSPLPDQDLQILPPKEEIKTETMQITTETLIPQIDLTEQDIKHSKKKNKKKKQRSDSEKSDKNEELISCTAAHVPQKSKGIDYEKPYEEKSAAADIENLPNAEESLIKSGSQDYSSKETEEHMAEKDLESKERNDEIFPVENQELKELQKPESKNRKKNKKEKKQLLKTDDTENLKSKDLVKEIVTTQFCDIITSTSAQEKNLDNVMTIEQEVLENFAKQEESSKSKAQIAKPVDKKRKAKHDIKEGENMSQKIGSSEHKIQPEPVQPLLETLQTVEHAEVQPQNEQIASYVSETKTSSDEGIIIPIDEEKYGSDMSTISKSAKSSDVTEISIEIVETTQPAEQAGTLMTKPENMENLLSTDVNPVDDTIFQDIIENVTQSQDVERSEATANFAKLFEDNSNKQRKKKKKTPKIPLSPEAAIDTKDENNKIADSIKIDQALQDNEVMQHTNEDIGLHLTEKVEIKIDKAVVLDSPPCDITPDILYPRSISQQHLDDNNNMVIQEMFIDDAINIPIVMSNTPLIEGSGETPIGTPEMVASGIRITEIEVVTPIKEEKTDIKSKMMEVNQDMEELRLSIEKSLAEFTSLEKSEKNKEKIFEEKCSLTFTDNTTDIENLPIPVTENQNNDKLSTIENQRATSEIQCQISSHVNPIAEMLETKNIYYTQQEGLTVGKEAEGGEKIVLSVDNTQNQQDVPLNLTASSNEQRVEVVQESSAFIDKSPPIIPARKDNKGKGKKRKGRHDVNQSVVTAQSSDISQSKDSQTEEVKKDEKTEQKAETNEEKGKQQTCFFDNDCSMLPNDNEDPSNSNKDIDYEPIESFEDALTSSVDDVNQTFEMMVSEVVEKSQHELAANKPDINVIAPTEDDQEKQVEEHPISQPKNLLGHPDIPVQSNKTDYKKEKNKTPNTRQARVKIKDAVNVETPKQSKECQTENKQTKKDTNRINESFSQVNKNDDFIYKYSFRKVFLQNSCHVCKKELSRMRVPCNFCSLVFYCSTKHKDEDWAQHQALCFAVSTIVHLKDQKHIYADAKSVTGHNYRLLRMQMILSCEKVLKRRLVPWEQEALLYPRICADSWCREWRQNRLMDCEGCGQISFCGTKPDHLPKSHQRWCKSYLLYQKLVTYQQTKGRLEPRLPSKVMSGQYEIPEKINEVLANMYEEKIDMNDIQYATLTQIATAPLTAAFCLQIYKNKMQPIANGITKKTSFTIHLVGAELQFEADALNKWEVFFLHLRPDVQDLTVVMISTDLNPGKLPLELLGKIKLCENCRQNKRYVTFRFQDKRTYQEYRNSDDFIEPDLICAFNANIQRSTVYNGKDPWPSTITSVAKTKSPFVVTSHTVMELQRDLMRVKECAPEINVMVDPKYNTFASVRPDRNFISDDEMPLLFKNYCFMILCGV